MPLKHFLKSKTYFNSCGKYNTASEHKNKSPFPNHDDQQAFFYKDHASFPPSHTERILSILRLRMLIWVCFTNFFGARAMRPKQFTKWKTLFKLYTSVWLTIESDSEKKKENWKRRDVAIPCFWLKVKLNEICDFWSNFEPFSEKIDVTFFLMYLVGVRYASETLSKVENIFQ